MISKSFIEKTKEVFEIFSEAFDELESQKPTIQKVIPVYEMMVAELTDLETKNSDQDSIAINLLISNLKEQIDLKYKTEFRTEYEIATFLDPAYKYLINFDSVKEKIIQFASNHNFLDSEKVILQKI